MEIRLIRPGEGELLRRARLALLAEAPWREALLDSEQTKPADYWEERARQGATGETLATLIATEADDCLGLVDLVPGAERRETAELAGMWVHPRRRRSGIGRAVTEAAIAWARAHGFATVALWVVESNESAIGLYEACGFDRAGDPVPVRGHEGLRQLYLTRPA